MILYLSCIAFCLMLFYFYLEKLDDSRDDYSYLVFLIFITVLFIFIPLIPELRSWYNIPIYNVLELIGLFFIIIFISSFMVLILKGIYLIYWYLFFLKLEDLKKDILDIIEFESRNNERDHQLFRTKLDLLYKTKSDKRLKK